MKRKTNSNCDAYLGNLVFSSRDLRHILLCNSNKISSNISFHPACAQGRMAAMFLLIWIFRYNVCHVHLNFLINFF